MTNLRNNSKLSDLKAMGTNSTTCPGPMKATSNGVFQGENPLDHALPLLILQICIVLLLTRLLAFLLRPLRQPRVIAEIVVRLSYLFTILSLNPFWGKKIIYIHIGV